jgi:hypothetical protein
VDIPHVDEELAADGLELAGARLEHLRDNMWFTLWQEGQMHVPCPKMAGGPGNVAQYKQKCLSGRLG